MSSMLGHGEFARIVLSSASLSVGFTTMSHWLLRLRAQHRLADREPARPASPGTQVAINLGDFAGKCQTRIFAIKDAFEDSWNNRQTLPLCEIDPVPPIFPDELDWSSLPPSLMVWANMLQTRFDITNALVVQASTDAAGELAAMALEIQRLAHYGKEACDKAREIHHGCGNPLPLEIISYETTFLHEIERAWRRYQRCALGSPLIDELQTEFKRRVDETR